MKAFYVSSKLCSAPDRVTTTGADGNPVARKSFRPEVSPRRRNLKKSRS
jgi:hypothetical protein